MQKQCFGISTPLNVGSNLSETPALEASETSGIPAKQVLAVAGEIQSELAGMRICPAPCKDGMIQVSPPSGSPRRVRCPLLNEFCSYGTTLGRDLEMYLNKLALNAGVPARHIECFNACIETPALTWANQWSFNGFLVLSGKSGVGKSFGAAWAFKEFLRSKIPEPLNTKTWSRAAYAGEHAMWSTANRIIHDRDRIEGARKKLFLVLDDLGREGTLPTRQADVSDIVSARYGAKLPTVITTELTFRDVLKTYGRNTAYKFVEDNDVSGGMFAGCGDVSLRGEDIWESENEA
jgi:DNA replication protein DnaC